MCGGGGSDGRVNFSSERANIRSRDSPWQHGVDICCSIYRENHSGIAQQARGLHAMKLRLSAPIARSIVRRRTDRDAMIDTLSLH